MVRILEQIPEVSLCGGARAAPEVFLLLALLLGLGQEPPGPVVSVLTAGLQVEIIEAPVLQLLAEVLNTNLQTVSLSHCISLRSLYSLPPGRDVVCLSYKGLEWRQSSWGSDQSSILS